VTDAEKAFLGQLHTVATAAAEVKALMEAVVPKDVAKWQMTADIQQLRKEAQGMSRTLRQQKQVGGGTASTGFDCRGGHTPGNSMTQAAGCLSLVCALPDAASSQPPPLPWLQTLSLAPVLKPLAP
jgi:hypothetical protein